MTCQIHGNLHSCSFMLTKYYLKSAYTEPLSEGVVSIHKCIQNRVRERSHYLRLIYRYLVYIINMYEVYLVYSCVSNVYSDLQNYVNAESEEFD